MVTFPFLRTFKPMLKRARGTASYEDVRQLLKLWLHCRRLRSLLDNQNRLLYVAARQVSRDQACRNK